MSCVDVTCRRRGKLARAVVEQFEARAKRAENFCARQAVKAHRIHLLAAAEEDLGKVKRQFFLQLAKDRGVLADYLREVKVLRPRL